MIREGRSTCQRCPLRARPFSRPYAIFICIYFRSGTGEQYGRVVLMAQHALDDSSCIGTCELNRLRRENEELKRLLLKKGNTDSVFIDENGGGRK
jgi:hypothetical protein